MSNLDDQPSEPFIITRSSEVLNPLSLADRWEVTRRNPYYLLLWETSSQISGTSEADNHLRDSARLILSAIGANDLGISPATSVEGLEIDRLENGWINGAISPVRIGNLILLLSGFLTSEGKATAASLLRQSIDIDLSQPSGGSINFIRQLTQGGNSEFDKYLPNLIITINPHAAQTVITESVANLVRDFKAQNDIPEHRRRKDKLPEYLEIWDLREGWTGAGYDIHQERTFKEISHDHKISSSTAANQYYSAFKLIIGQEYHADVWAKTLGLIKLSQLTGGTGGRLSARRPLNRRLRREIPESALQTDGKLSGREFLGLAGIHRDEIEVVDLALDIQELAARGWDDNRIAEELGLAPSDVAPLRKYFDDRQTSSS